MKIGAATVVAAAWSVAEGKERSIPTPAELGWADYVTVDAAKVMVMHAVEDCTLDTDVDAYVAEIKAAVNEEAGVAIAAYVENQKNFASVSTMSVKDKSRFRRDVNMDVLAVLAGMTKAEDGGAALAASLAAAAHPSKGLRRRLEPASDLGVHSLSKSFMDFMVGDVVEDPEGKLNSRELIDLLKLLPCLATDPEYDVIIPPEHAWKVDTNDPVSQWHLKASGITGMTGGWETFTGYSKGMTIGVVDSGCTYHPDLAENFWVDTSIANCTTHTAANPVFDAGCYGWDYGEGDGNPMNEPLDGQHGTSVAGMIAARPNNSYATAGSCWGCKLACLKVSTSRGELPVTATIEAMNYMGNKGIYLSNHSYGAGGTSGSYNTAVERLRSAGHLMVVAAGNDSCDLDNDPKCNFFPSGLPYDNVFTIGSSSGANVPSSFSNYGKISVDIFAPGGQVATLANTRFTGTTTTIDGTSFASPLVAGMAAVVWEAYGGVQNYNYLDVKNKIMNTYRSHTTGWTGKAVKEGTADLAAALLGAPDTDYAPRSPEASPLVDWTDAFYNDGAVSARGAGFAGLAAVAGLFLLI